MELFAMALVVSRADAERRAGVPEAEASQRLADVFCRTSRRRVRELFRSLWHNDDALAYRVGQEMLTGRYEFLERRGLGLGLDPGDLEPVLMSEQSQRARTA
jgi:hypothetical protein